MHRVERRLAEDSRNAIHETLRIPW
jgi:hypothetical protein